MKTKLLDEIELYRKKRNILRQEFLKAYYNEELRKAKVLERKYNQCVEKIKELYLEMMR